MAESYVARSALDSGPRQRRKEILGEEAKKLKKDVIF